jgi:flavin-dependent dehydrogenase
MLLARQGLKVTLIDRARHAGTDTLSTHALMRGGVLQLHRWGLLPAIAAATPAIRQTLVHYGDEAHLVEIQERAGIDALYAPRRTVLDRLLVEAAVTAGVEVHYATSMRQLVHDRQRVFGVEVTQGGRSHTLRAPLVIGADGVRSRVAEQAGAADEWRGRGASAFLYGYWPTTDASRYEWFYRPGACAGVIPTNDGLSCIWAGTSAERFAAAHQGDLPATFARLLREAAPEVAESVLESPPAGALRGFPGMPSFVRRASGPGWALVGDAGAFRDPISAHGITDALRDAELLAAAAAQELGRHGSGLLAEAERLVAYESARRTVGEPLALIVDRVARYDWNLDELRDLLIDLSRTMSREVEQLASLPAIGAPSADADAA